VEDFSKSTIHYWMFLNGGFGVGGGGEEKGKKTREEKGERGKGNKRDPVFCSTIYAT
jgi:hypothetical protein